MGNLTLNKYLRLIIAVIIIISNVLIDHFFAPTGLLLSPIIIIIVSILINLSQEKFNIFYQAFLTFFLLSFNDIGIKLYGGGIHDSEGQGVVNLLLLVSLLPCFIILVVSIFTNKEISILKKIISISLFLLFTCIYIYFFQNLGMAPQYL